MIKIEILLEVQLIFDPVVNQSSKPSRDQISNSNSKGNSRSSSSNSAFDKSLRSNSISTSNSNLKSNSNSRSKIRYWERRSFLTEKRMALMGFRNLVKYDLNSLAKCLKQKVFKNNRLILKHSKDHVSLP